MIHNSLYTVIGLFLKRITGIKDVSLQKKKLHKKLGKLIFYKKYTAKDIVSTMQSMGMKRGSVVCIHASMMEFYNYEGTANDLIAEVLESIGIEGTLIMPSSPSSEKLVDPNYIFDRNADPTAAGYLAETFRKYPGVKRSINARHSVCALGKMADYIIKDHQNCHDCWDKNSPWYKMCKLNAFIFNLGMPRSYIGTFHHCVESLLQDEHPYWKQFFVEKYKHRYYDDSYNLCEYIDANSYIDRRTKENRVTKYFTDNDWQIRKISNLEIKVFYSRSCLNKMIALGRKGITVYYVPSPKKFRFNE